DLYELLDVPQLSCEDLVKKAYKKQALKLHPDKNPNNSKAVEQFQLLQKVYEFFLDPIKKNEYDSVIRAREQAEKKKKEMDVNRKRFAEKLIADEARAKKQRLEEDVFKQQEELRKRAELKAEMEREAVEERERLKRKQMKESKMREDENNGGYNVKIKWKLSQDYDYDENVLRKIFSRYGVVKELIFSGNKKGLCLVQYSGQEQALASLDEVGLPSCPLKV
ncbi:hypothetical protein HELRODRAFT_124201, partial [Helobdella robusta]|uniref:J domain-containing protein n=1 Tax=Helobdella robusta TaxID=6412 RepID=T1EH03_HELRO